MKISKKVKIAIDKAEKEARKEVLKPKKKRKVVKNNTEQQANPSGKWIKDEWGDQGEIFFDGKLYWIIRFKFASEDMWEAKSTALSEEQWEDYKKKPIKLGLPAKLETSGTKKRLSSTQKTTSSTKPSKRKLKKKSSTNAGKTVTQPKQVKWQ